jgi:hypothetical protein
MKLVSFPHCMLQAQADYLHRQSCDVVFPLKFIAHMSPPLRTTPRLLLRWVGTDHPLGELAEDISDMIDRCREHAHRT